MSSDPNETKKNEVSDDEANAIKGGAKKISSSVGKGGKNKPAGSIEDGLDFRVTTE